MMTRKRVEIVVGSFDKRSYSRKAQQRAREKECKRSEDGPERTAGCRQRLMTDVEQRQYRVF